LAFPHGIGSCGRDENAGFAYGDGDGAAGELSQVPSRDGHIEIINRYTMFLYHCFFYSAATKAILVA